MNRKGAGKGRAIAVIATVAAVAAAIVGAGVYYVKSQLDHITLTAQFDNASGLYESNVVAVLGMPVGKITKITPQSGYVDVEFTVDKDVKVPVDVQAVTLSTSILTDRQVELTPPYRGGPTLQDGDTIGLDKTKTPVEFDRVLGMLDKLSVSLKGDGNGQGPVSDIINAAAGVADGNGDKIKSGLDELSKALRLSSEGGVTTREQMTTIIKNVSSLFDAAAANDGKLREFSTTIHQLSNIIDDEALGTGNTGRQLNDLVTQAGDILDANRDHIKQSILNGNTALKTVVDNQRELAETIDVAPLAVENLYNTVDQDNGSFRARFLTDKLLFESQTGKEICNLMGLRQLGLQHRHVAGLRPRLRPDLCARRARGDGTKVMAIRKRLAAMGAATAIALSGCATNGLGDLPLPAPGVGTGGYHLTALFSNILNLPTNAKVKLAGADVGQVDDMRVSNYTAITTLRILDGVRLPKGSTAELRSATPLGDVFVSIRPPAGAPSDGPILKEGDTIGLDETTAAATVESVLSSAALVSNGGAVRNLTNVINGFGKATGDQGQAFGDLIKDSNRLLGTLNTRSSQISEALTQTAQLADQLDTKNQTLTDIVKEADPATETLAANTAQLSQLVLQIGATTQQLQKFPSIAGTDTSGHSIIKDANTIAKAWNDVAQDPTVDINALNRQFASLIKITPSDTISVRVSIDRLILGSIPDAGFKGDVGSHGPKRYNWAQLVGSFKYTLWRLQERVVGKGVYGEDVPMRPSPTEPGVIERVPGPPPGAPVPPPPGQAVPAAAPAETTTPTPAPAPPPGPAPGPGVMGQ